MFSQVRQAILPLALRQLQSRGDLERAGLLIESLARHWRDSKPFQLLIVSPHRDVQLLRSSLPRFANIDVSVRSESDFFPFYSRFYLLPGWYRQQVVKLHVPAQLGFDGYLTLDSDVACVGDFDAATFLDGGRALSRWEPKRHHEWWPNAATAVGLPYDVKAHGLSVTPNILHGKLAAQTLEHFRLGPIDPMSSLGALVLRKIGTIQWTEYSLYTCVAELEATCSTITSIGIPATSTAPSSSPSSPACGVPMISSGWSSCPTATIPAASSSSCKATRASRSSRCANTA